ncbi:MAG TPA: hypothetical protein VF627_15620 [Abditibacterium sp.]|jgi:alpha/beta superfamily hydrolase
MALEAFFFPTTDDLRLFGVWRGPSTAQRAWILCPPWAEEEKSARRALTQIACALEACGQSSLLFSFRGTGDSEGDFAAASLTQWRADLQAAREQLAARAPDAALGLLGVRLGASLALLEAKNLAAQRLILIEPLLSGRSFLMQQSAKKQIRAQLTSDAPHSALRADDLDGWPLGATMKAELQALDLKREIEPEAQIAVWQVGPRPEVTPALQNFASTLGADARAIVMPPFWNLLDSTDPQPLLDALESEVSDD